MLQTNRAAPTRSLSEPPSTDLNGIRGATATNSSIQFEQADQTGWTRRLHRHLRHHPEPAKGAIAATLIGAKSGRSVLYGRGL
jgi:hypothetical protein